MNPQPHETRAITHVIRDSETHGPPPMTRWVLWFTFLGPPVIWLTHLQVIYTTVDVACKYGIVWPFHASTGVSLGLVFFAGALGQHQRRSPRGNTDAERERSRFMGTLGISHAALSFVLIATQAAAIFVFEPCLR